MKDFPAYVVESFEDLKEWVRYVSKERSSDVKDFDNLKKIFMSRQKVGTIPVGAATSSTARIGDYNADEDYFYLVVPVGATSEWRRVAWTAW